MRREEVINSLVEAALEAYDIGYFTPNMDKSDLDRVRGKYVAYLEALSLLKGTDEDEEWDYISSLHKERYSSFTW